MHWLERQWYRLGLWHLVLLPLSLLFRVLTAVRRLLYRFGLLESTRLPVPVVVVGNISVGGTGKTPLVIWLVEFLRRRGFTPGVISRGYGGTARQPMPVEVTTPPALAGDEPLLISRRTGCPVWVGKQRVANGRALLQAHPACDVLISDDGLQHYALQRNVEVAVVDGERRFGNGLLLPAGPLREPQQRLATVDAVVTLGAEPLPQSYGMSLQGVTFRNLLDGNRVATAADFINKRLHAVAGIGNPTRFFAQLQRMGLEVTTHAFPDHHPFVEADLQFERAEAILMTEKDAVKCSAFAQPHWWYLEVSAEVGDALGEHILLKLRKNDGR